MYAICELRGTCDALLDELHMYYLYTYGFVDCYDETTRDQKPTCFVRLPCVTSTFPGNLIVVVDPRRTTLRGRRSNERYRGFICTRELISRL